MVPSSRVPRFDRGGGRLRMRPCHSGGNAADDDLGICGSGCWAGRRSAPRGRGRLCRPPENPYSVTGWPQMAEKIHLSFVPEAGLWVPVARIERARPCGPADLSLLRLPISANTGHPEKTGISIAFACDSLPTLRIPYRHMTRPEPTSDAGTLAPSSGRRAGVRRAGPGRDLSTLRPPRPRTRRAPPDQPGGGTSPKTCTRTPFVEVPAAHRRACADHRALRRLGSARSPLEQMPHGTCASPWPPEARFVARSGSRAGGSVPGGRWPTTIRSPTARTRTQTRPRHGGACRALDARGRPGYTMSRGPLTHEEIGPVVSGRTASFSKSQAGARATAGCAASSNAVRRNLSMHPDLAEPFEAARLRRASDGPPRGTRCRPATPVPARETRNASGKLRTTLRATGRMSVDRTAGPESPLPSLDGLPPHPGGHCRGPNLAPGGETMAAVLAIARRPLRCSTGLRLRAHRLPDQVPCEQTRVRRCQ